MEPVLTLDNIGFRYSAEWAIRGINLTIMPGEIIGILGPNGSGKSTLLKVMDGILLPQEGTIRLGDRSLGRLKRSEIAKTVAMVAQENHFRFAFSVMEVVLMGRFPHLKRMQFEGEHDLRIACNALQATHTFDLSERPIHELSGGEKQRVLIARSLAQEPRLVLLDEPTSFLDLKYKREIFRLIESLSTDKGLSVVLVSHDIDLAAQYCHRLLLLKDGGVYRWGAPDAVITESTIAAVYDCPVIVDTNPSSGRPRVSLVK